MRNWAIAAVGVLAAVVLFLLQVREEEGGVATPPVVLPEPPNQPVLHQPPASTVRLQAETADASPSVSRPMLPLSSHQELDARTARLQRCLESSLCGAGEMCGVSTSGVVGCFSSNCSGPGDGSCGAGFVCARVSAGVFRCITQGVLGKRELCSATFGVNAPAEQRCGAGLECVAGRCTRGCDAGCESDEVCERAGDDSFCIPRRDLCKSTSDCGAGRWCWREDEGSGLCVQPHPDPLGTGQPSCLPGTCGPGAECTGFVDGQLFRGECSRACATAADCKPSESCGAVRLPRGATVCAQSCDPFGTDCPYGKACFASLDGGSFCRLEADVDYATANNAASMFSDSPTRVVP